MLKSMTAMVPFRSSGTDNKLGYARFLKSDCVGSGNMIEMPSSTATCEIHLVKVASCPTIIFTLKAYSLVTYNSDPKVRV